jgi:hypothetical protein
MLFSTPTEWAALGLTLLAGWLWGFASHSGGKKWRRQLQEEEVSSAAYRDQAERELRDLRERVRQLESDAPAKPAAPAPAAAAAAPTVDSEPVKTWIPEGPPPPPLAMGTPEPAPQPAPQPIVADATPQPAPASEREEVKSAATDQNFSGQNASAEPQAAFVAAPDQGGTADPASPAPAAASAPAQTPIDGVQKGHEWLPSHVRADAKTD